jgi:hypothetical protein
LLTAIYHACSINHVDLASKELLLLVVIGLMLTLAKSEVLLRLTLSRSWVLLTVVVGSSVLDRRLNIRLRGLRLSRRLLGLNLLEGLVRPIG